MSAELAIGISDEKKPSSRVLKPPGGGHSNIFAPPEVKANPPRPKYNQQNSSNLNCVMNTVDPNIVVGKNSENSSQSDNTVEEKLSPPGAGGRPQMSQQNIPQTGTRGRVPPGGFSSGLW